MKINITVPVWNEAKILPVSIPYLIDHLTAHLKSYEWFVVIADNNSDDSTGTVANTLAEKYPNVFYIHTAMKGRGYALKHSWLKFPAEFYGYIDADMDIHPSALSSALNELKKGYDISIGSRLHPGSTINRSWYRNFLTTVSTALVHVMFPSMPADVQCGVKMLRQNVVDNIVPSLSEKGWCFDAELLLRSKKLGFNIAEVPINLKTKRLGPRDSTVSLGADSLKFLICLAKFKKWDCSPDVEIYKVQK